jgi:hypothetical protein
VSHIPRVARVESGFTLEKVQVGLARGVVDLVAKQHEDAFQRIFVGCLFLAKIDHVRLAEGYGGG